MKKNIFNIVFIIYITIFTSCSFNFGPQLLSAKFIDDKTLECEFAIVLGKETTGNYTIYSYTLTPATNSKLYFQSSGMTKLKAYFTNDIPDGTNVELHFRDPNDKDVFSCTFTKGDEDSFKTR